MFFALSIALVAFGVFQSYVMEVQLSTRASQVVLSPEMSKKFLHTAREVRADMLCNSIGQLFQKIVSWLAAGLTAL